MTQNQLFQFFNPEEAKKGKSVCSMCKRPVRWYAKTLDRRLISILAEILCFVKGDFTYFDLGDALNGSHLKICDAQKLKYWYFIVQDKKRSGWRITRKAIDFMSGNLQVPYRVWVWRNEVADADDRLVHIGNIEPRFQKYRSDWSLDYLPMIHKIQEEYLAMIKA